MNLKNALSMALPAAALMTASGAALGDGGDHAYMGHMGWGWGAMIIGPIMMIAFIAVAVAVVVLVVRWLGGTGQGGAHHGPPGGTALDILKERFAKGEIDAEEFAERRRVLGD